MPQRTILVTGGAGFIGGHVCRALVGQGVRVRCLDSFVTGRRDNIADLVDGSDFRLLEADIRDLDACMEAVDGVGAVVHLAALGSVPRSIDDPLASEAANLTGCLQVLEACRRKGVRRVVYASSSSVYGDSAASPKQEGTEGTPLSPYAVTKVMNEAYAGLYHRLFGLETIGLRFFNVFGEHQDPEGPYAAAIPRFIARLLDHRPPVLNGDGRQTRDFTYVGNAVQAVLAALATARTEAFGGVFNVACGRSTDLLTLVDLLRKALVEHDPAVAGIAVEHGPERPGDVRASLADIERARMVLGYDPQYAVEQGLDRAVPWYVQHLR
ncbi:MAG: NAD-dependent epimerase/dehydratase family protein [Flavobacteriales bacterium]|nr:UDP-N-acetylglucosamine 4-epimerase [Flavobacteriales bacterium]MCC6578660.1 NAD-dependent epimerase/dehydratase family protein [Flavobacteriales bacterium]NUQ14500.1 NAD-dependent epimerase/dehydratase family protein [Flavobacteriales bacterium]